jgi:hypothetical protein
MVGRIARGVRVSLTPRTKVTLSLGFCPRISALNPSSAPQGQVSTPDGPDRNSASGLAVDADTRVENVLPSPDLGLVKISGRRFTPEIDEVDQPILIAHRLRLDPFPGWPEQYHLRSVRHTASRREERPRTANEPADREDTCYEDRLGPVPHDGVPGW